MTAPSYTEEVREFRKEIGAVDRKLGELNTNVATLAEHVANQNGRIGKVEVGLDKQEEIVIGLRIGAEGARVTREGNQGFVDLVRRNIWNILQGIILVVILAQLGLK